MLDQFGVISQADQRPLEAMLQCGMPEKVFGHCVLVEDPGMRVHLLQEHASPKRLDHVREMVRRNARS